MIRKLLLLPIRLPRLPRGGRVAVSAALVLAVAITVSACGGKAATSGTDTNVADTNAAGTGSSSSSESFDRSNYGMLASDPDAHKGARVSFVGKVFAAPERDDQGIYMQVWADPQDSEWNTIVAFAEPAFQVEDGDYVRVSGSVKGAFHGKNAFGTDLLATTVIADTVQVVDAVAAAPPSLSTYGRATYTQAGVTVTVQKIEVAAAETRVFVTVRNRSAQSVSVYGSSMKLVAGGRQFDPTYSTADYPDLSSEVVPGAASSGVVVFPKVARTAALKLYADAHSDDVNVGDYGDLTYTFTWK